MRRELRSVHDRLGITTIFVTHDQEEAMTVCDRIAVLDQGVVQQVGSPVELYDRPANRFVAHFVGSVNLFEGTLEPGDGGRVFRSAALGAVALPAAFDAPASGAVEIAFRPHAIALGPAGAPAQGDALNVEGVIEDGEFLGEFMRYEVRVGNALVVADHPHAWGSARLAPGSAVRLAVPAREIRLIR
jgi:iron(III) transport system ATP-binding protein